MIPPGLFLQDLFNKFDYQKNDIIDISNQNEPDGLIENFEKQVEDFIPIIQSSLEKEPIKIPKNAIFNENFEKITEIEENQIPINIFNTDIEEKDIQNELKNKKIDKKSATKNDIILTNEQILIPQMNSLPINEYKIENNFISENINRYQNKNINSDLRKEGFLVLNEKNPKTEEELEFIPENIEIPEIDFKDEKKPDTSFSKEISLNEKILKSQENLIEKNEKIEKPNEAVMIEIKNNASFQKKEEKEEKRNNENNSSEQAPIEIHHEVMNEAIAEKDKIFTDSKLNIDFSNKISSTSIKKIIEFAEELKTKHGGQAKISLSDPEFGKIEIHLKIDKENKAFIEIKTTSEFLKNNFEGNAHFLKDELEKKNIKLESIHSVNSNPSQIGQINHQTSILGSTLASSDFSSSQGGFYEKNNEFQSNSYMGNQKNNDTNKKDFEEFKELNRNETKNIKKREKINLNLNHEKKISSIKINA